jgi:glycosyltransferase involved in cell wall biosynthesis
VRKVLFHSYHFPPIGGSGAQRPLKMVRFLRDHGYDSLVVTSGGATADRWAPEDATLAAELPAETEVRRVVNTDEPELSAGMRLAAERWLGVPDPWATWWTRKSYELAHGLGDGADLIYVWMQPYTSAKAGAALSRELGKPWVADLGDPWALDEMMVYPSGLHRSLDLRRMGSLLGTASAIVMSTPEAAARLVQAFPELCDRPVVAIPNGFDRDDFAGDAPTRGNGKFWIVHTGYLHTELGLAHRRRQGVRRALGGSAPGLDILTRSHVHLVEAVNRLLADDPSLREVVELHFAGVLNETDKRIAAECPVARVHGYLSHAESIALMRDADILFLPMQNLPPGARATIVPGKTYEYLASGSPILAAVPEGDARDILEEAGNAIVVRPDDLDGMTEALGKSLALFRDGERPAPPRAEVVARFEYRKLAGDLAGVFDAVLGTGDQEGGSNQP